MQIHLTLILAFFFTTLSLPTYGQAKTQFIPYYGEEFYSHLDKKVDQKTLRQSLNKVLSSAHIINGGLDKIVDSCPPAEKNCYQHEFLTYSDARREMFGRLFLVGEKNSYSIHDAYCDKNFNSSDFPKNAQPGPGRIPSSTIMNAEHTWPQSRFNKKKNPELQRSDLHILFPVSSVTNTQRSNHAFGDVETRNYDTCPAANKGKPKGDRPEAVVFEPPDNQKGNSARAIFYFAIRYEMRVPPGEEATLRQWNRLDPVDQDELDRNNEIFRIQKTRNPFVDFADLIDRFENL